MTNPLFSILIANYNNSEFLEECIGSIRSQIYQNWEVIFVDDCSVDDSLTVIRKLADKDSRFSIYENKENGGCGYTKRRCAELARGSLCAYLDPDDALVPDAIALMVDAHQKIPEASLIGSRRFFCNGQLKVIDVAPPLTQKIRNFRNQLETPFVITHFASFKKSAYDKTEGLDPYMKRAIDQDLYLKLEEQGKVAFIDKPLYYYRNSSHSISLNDNHYKATAWHVYAVINACKRRNLPFDNYCYLTRHIPGAKEKFINALCLPVAVLKIMIQRKKNIRNYKQESSVRQDLILCQH